MRTLSEQIEHWKEIGEWEDIKRWYVQADTQERYFEIVQFVHNNKARFGHRYREQILSDSAFIARFGCLDLEYLKKALKMMNKTDPKV